MQARDRVANEPSGSVRFGSKAVPLQCPLSAKSGHGGRPTNQKIMLFPPTTLLMPLSLKKHWFPYRICRPE